MSSVTDRRIRWSQERTLRMGGFCCKPWLIDLRIFWLFNRIRRTQVEDLSLFGNFNSSATCGFRLLGNG